MSEEADRADVPPADRLTTLWRRTKEHHIAQWTVGYVAVAYGIQHAVTLTSEAFRWPDGVIRISMLLLALGLPVAMTLAWYHGERANRRVSGGEATIVALLLVLILFVFYFVVRPANEIASGARLASVTAPAAANGISLAVLPFVNLSHPSTLTITIPALAAKMIAVTGEEVQFNITFTTPISLGPDHVFFRSEVDLGSAGNFLWLSAPKPIVPPGTRSLDRWPVAKPSQRLLALTLT